MIKQGYEDFKRHRADREINDRKVEVLREGKMKSMKSEEIRVGDIVKVQSGALQWSEITIKTL